MTFDKESIEAYPARAAAFIEGKGREDYERKTVLRSCLAHFMHVMSRHLNIVCVRIKAMSFILYAVAILIDTRRDARRFPSSELS